MRNIWVHDVEMDRVKSPFRFELNWFPSYSYPPRPKNIPESEWPAHWKVMLTKVVPPERGIPEFHNLRISNVKVTNAGRAIYANAYSEKPIRNVHFENVTIEARGGGKMNHCKDWTMKNVIVRATTPIETKNCINVELPKQEKK